MQSNKVGIGLSLAGAVMLGIAAYVFWTTEKPAPRALAVDAGIAGGADLGVESATVSAELDAPVEPDAANRPRASPRETLRRVARSGTKSARMAEWLKADGIVRRLAAAVRLVSVGRSPRSVLGFIKVSGRFSVVESWDPRARKKGLLPKGVKKGEDRVFIARASYARYDPIVDVFTRADAEAWGRGYRRVRPHFQAVFAEVAAPGERFDDVLAAALSRLVAFEVPEGQPELTSKGAIFYYKDPKLEALGEVEKHLLRLGAKNARAMQTVCRRFARVAGLAIR